MGMRGDLTIFFHVDQQPTSKVLLHEIGKAWARLLHPLQARRLNVLHARERLRFFRCS